MGVVHYVIGALVLSVDMVHGDFPCDPLASRSCACSLSATTHELNKQRHDKPSMGPEVIDVTQLGMDSLMPIAGNKNLDRFDQNHLKLERLAQFVSGRSADTTVVIKFPAGKTFILKDRASDYDRTQTSSINWSSVAPLVFASCPSGPEDSHERTRLWITGGMPTPVPARRLDGGYEAKDRSQRHSLMTRLNDPGEAKYLTIVKYGNPNRPNYFLLSAPSSRHFTPFNFYYGDRPVTTPRVVVYGLELDGNVGYFSRPDWKTEFTQNIGSPNAINHIQFPKGLPETEKSNLLQTIASQLISDPCRSPYGKDERGMLCPVAFYLTEDAYNNSGIQIGKFTKNMELHDVYVHDFPADGIVLLNNAMYGDHWSTYDLKSPDFSAPFNIKIIGSKISRNMRNGISITAGNQILVKDSEISSNGVPYSDTAVPYGISFGPSAGVDIEPNANIPIVGDQQSFEPGYAAVSSVEFNHVNIIKNWKSVYSIGAARAVRFKVGSISTYAPASLQEPYFDKGFMHPGPFNHSGIVLYSQLNSFEGVQITFNQKDSPDNLALICDEPMAQQAGEAPRSYWYTLDDPYAYFFFYSKFSYGGDWSLRPTRYSCHKFVRDDLLQTVRVIPDNHDHTKAQCLIRLNSQKCTRSL